MKRILCTTLVLLMLAAMGAAQTGSTYSPQAAQAPAPNPRKAPPAAKTPEEGAAYQAILGNPDLASSEAAIKDFETKYPQSELKGGLYQSLMYRYQQANDADKTVEMGRKAAQFDPDNPMALITVASVISERARPSDLDFDQHMTEATKDAQHALDTMDHWLATAPITDEQAKSVRPLLASRAHEAMGMLALKRSNAPEAEKHLRAAVELNTVSPEAITWLRLALALDAQKKYPDALAAANRAVELAAARGGMVADWAKQEQTRLSKLAPQPPPTAPAPAPAPPKP